jgi:hypothetical protein
MRHAVFAACRVFQHGAVIVERPVSARPQIVFVLVDHAGHGSVRFQGRDVPMWQDVR